jgi:MarR family transcriptional regulator, organic hydroperoxide resistance regulator
MLDHYGRMRVSPDEMTLDDQLCFALYGASMAISRAYKPVLDGLEITYPQYLVMSTLWERRSQSVGGIAERLALESSTITPLLKRLEQNGLVLRERNADDERQVLVSPTAKGLALRIKARCLGETLFVAAGMTPERLISLNREVQAFRDAVNGHIHRTGARDAG